MLGSVGSSSGGGAQSGLSSGHPPGILTESKTRRKGGYVPPLPHQASDSGSSMCDPMDYAPLPSSRPKRHHHPSDHMRQRMDTYESEGSLLSDNCKL